MCVVHVCCLVYPRCPASENTMRAPRSLRVHNGSHFHFLRFFHFFTASSLGVSYLQTAACAILVQGLNISPCLDYLRCSFVAGN